MIVCESCFTAIDYYDYASDKEIIEFVETLGNYTHSNTIMGISCCEVCCLITFKFRYITKGE